MQHIDIEQAAFSKVNLHNSLERLLKAFESKGMNVNDSLLPALTESEIKNQCSWFPGELTDEIIALYEWRGGQTKDALESEQPFWFRDNSFCSIERARFEYKSMMDSYGTYKPDHHMLKNAFPIASFNGAWYVIPTKGHNLASALKRPVISVHEGIVIYFYSIEKMVETCVEWVEHNNYSSDGLYPESIEMEIWKKHNPGIFS
ncbi:MAG: hypothetical protein VR64_22740 [Desulfatitalea sp. BRH_c12]|nr:MAG: hypothetical protein VR64_22740 [Desulfatitalea sp. BRH_c12]